MPSSLAAPEWPQDCGSGNAAALHAVGSYGLPDFMYFDAYPPPPTHDTAAAIFDLTGGFEGFGARTDDPSASAAPAWLSPPASSSEEVPDLQQQQPPPPSTFLPAFGGSSGHAPATPPEAADYLATSAAATFPPFTAPDSLGLIYPHPQPPPPPPQQAGAVLDPALFDDAAGMQQQQQQQPPTPPPSSSSSSSSTLLDPQHASLLHMAVASGNVEVLRLILDRVPAALARRPDGDGCTPAQRAARAGRPDMLAVLDHTTTHATTAGREASHGDPSPGFESMC